MKNAIINARIESDLKIDVEVIFKNLGITATQAINIFYQQVKLNNGLPFEVKIPKAETQKAIEDARAGIKGCIVSLENDFAQRSLIRRNQMTINKVSLHSKEHHSFHLDVDGNTLSKLVFDMSMNDYGTSHLQRLDKAEVKIIKLKDK